MLKNDKINIILALIIAIGMWSYVLAEVNPPMESSISGVPVTFEGEESLSSAGLVRLYSDINYVNVVVKGNRSNTSKVGKGDVKVVVDLEGLTQGSHELELEYDVPNSVEIIQKSNEKITVYIDNVITVEKDIVVNMTDDSDESKEPHIINVSNEKAYITGAATNVNRVKHIAAMLDIDKVNDKVSTFDVPLKAVDDKGMEVKGINVSIPSVSVDAVMLNTKTVKLEVPIVDDDNADVERTYNLPKDIVIKGTAETLENISSIEAKKIDLREIYKTSEVKIEPILPDGISVDEDSENLKMTVMVVGLETGKFTYNSEEVEIRGLKENLSAEVVDKNITITVKGKATVLNSLSKESFKLYLNASNISAGKHELEIKCDAAADIRDMTLNPDKLTVILTELNSDFDISDKEEISEE